MKNPIRDCPVCFHQEKRPLFRQNFRTLSSGSLLAGYDLVVCTSCGAAYADDIPPQEAFDRYYAEMSKYEYSDRAGIQTEKDLRQFREIVGSLAPHLSSDVHILDIGCATGGLLAEFKRRGFSNLRGVDPSPACAHLTQELYEIPARSLTLATLNQLSEKADLAVLTGVLEHVRDLTASLQSVISCLNHCGAVYVEVPDASRYDRLFSAPFQLFSMEHVNYFSPLSLTNLFAGHGFSVVFTRRLVRRLSPQAIEPTVGGLFRMTSDSTRDRQPVRDDETEPALRRYVEQSRESEKRIHDRINELVATAKPLAVWGVGTHTLRLLETSSLAKANIVSFIDSNQHYQGKCLAGRPVVAPSAFRDRQAEVLISSQTAEDEIFDLITKKMHWPNVVHRLYAES
jgi:predicted TPR repeat methyltransferase